MSEENPYAHLTEADGVWPGTPWKKYASLVDMLAHHNGICARRGWSTRAPKLCNLVTYRLPCNSCAPALLLMRATEGGYLVATWSPGEHLWHVATLPTCQSNQSPHPSLDSALVSFRHVARILAARR